MRILYAEDEHALSEAVSDILTYHKYAVDTVDNGTDALDYALAQRYDPLSRRAYLSCCGSAPIPSRKKVFAREEIACSNTPQRPSDKDAPLRGVFCREQTLSGADLLPHESDIAYRERAHHQRQHAC